MKLLATAEDEKKDPFEEIDFGSFFQDYLDPGYRTRQRDGRDRAAVIREFSFEAWKSYGSSCLATRRAPVCVRKFAKPRTLIIGNLNEDGYLIASDDELMGVAPPASPEKDAATGKEHCQ